MGTKNISANIAKKMGFLLKGIGVRHLLLTFLTFIALPSLLARLFYPKDSDQFYSWRWRAVRV
jgi:uncharacterized protein YqhQ